MPLTATNVPETDREVAVRALGGQQSAFSELMARHRDAVYRVARHHVGEESEALDVCQETFISAFASLNKYDLDRPFRAWLLRIALNKCRDWARRRAVRRLFRMAKPLDDAQHIADEGQDPESAAISARELSRISTAITTLPANLKDPLILCRLEGMSMAEAAQVLGVSEKAVETRIYRARQKLSEILEG